jgi:Fic family protein
MLKEQRKLIILNFANTVVDFKNNDIADLFDKQISKKTTSRDLNELLTENLLAKFGNGAKTRYKLSKQYSVFKNIDFDKYFSVDFKDRVITEQFNFGIFDLLKNDIFNQVEHEKLQNLQQQFIKKFTKHDSQTTINKEFERIMIEFSWKSSVIEGNTYSLLNTEALIKDNILATGKTQFEAQMILNHKDCFNESMQNRDAFLDLNFATIDYMHKTLTKKLDIGSSIRSSAVGITGTKYKPLDNKIQLKDASLKMIDLINSKKSFFEKSFLALLLISYLQMFEDGNKRCARMLSNSILLANNSIPLSYRIVDIVEYKKASIIFYETHNLTYFKKVFISQFVDSVENYF